ncbi:YmzC family protein [Bacillus pumilus]|uniref:YmzC family protein n=1 Tax=Bacillus pumilus TaxID=1408 RepID=UPI001CFC283A|nr:YmzC family protein [Bacillus pumilus]UCZ72482.1 YmzC family protein [Bacillus pumilus]
MENAELELRRIRVILLLIGIVVLFGSCAISNIESRQESSHNYANQDDNGHIEGLLQSAVALKNNHFAVVNDDEVHVYRFDEKEGELTLVKTKYIDEWDEEYDDDSVEE